jgi:hypothetical protein
MSGGPVRFRDKGLLAGLAVLLALDPASRRERLRNRPWTPPQLPRWMRRMGKPGPYNKDRECARRRRQIAKGMLKVTAPR